jgi:Rrf2 family protein
MVSLSKKVDYALISLAHLVSNQDRVASAREIAQLHRLPLPLVMNILKRLHQQGVLSSTRGVKGGYQIAIDLDELSLAQLIEIVEAEHEARRPLRLSLLPPVQGLQFRLMRLLRQLRVTDLVKPGRRIDVPSELVRVAKEHVPAPLKLPA